MKRLFHSGGKIIALTKCYGIFRCRNIELQMLWCRAGVIMGYIITLNIYILTVKSYIVRKH